MQCASSITSSPTDAANSGSMSSRKRGLFSRSGLISSRSTVPAARSSRTWSHSLAVGAVDRVRAQPEPLGGGDLVAHQREQRADDQRRARAGLAQQRRGDEVDGRLAPPGALDAEHARAVGDDVVDRLELVRAELRRRIAREGAEAIQGGVGERVRGSDGGKRGT